MRTTQKKGDLAVSQAIATFTKLGYDVSIPLTESARYDLVVDEAGQLFRVQVKYSTSGMVDLRHVHSNAQGYVVTHPKPEDYDWLYVLDGTGKEYLLKEGWHRNTAIAMKDEYLVSWPSLVDGTDLENRQGETPSLVQI